MDGIVALRVTLSNRISFERGSVISEWSLLLSWSIDCFNAVMTGSRCSACEVRKQGPTSFVNFSKPQTSSALDSLSYPSHPIPQFIKHSFGIPFLSSLLASWSILYTSIHSFRFQPSTLVNVTVPS
jgi:hypothetical protein